MNIPNMPKDPLLSKNPANGQLDMHPAWQSYFSQLTTSLQQNVSDEGFVIPQVTNEQLAVLNTPASNARIIYNSDTNQMMANLNGTYQTITTS
jgi:hypothetical protein